MSQPFGCQQRHKLKWLLTGRESSSGKNCNDSRFANTPPKSCGVFAVPYHSFTSLVPRVPGMEQCPVTSGEFAGGQRRGLLLELARSCFFNGKRSQAGISRVCRSSFGAGGRCRRTGRKIRV